MKKYCHRFERETLADHGKIISISPEYDDALEMLLGNPDVLEVGFCK